MYHGSLQYRQIQHNYFVKKQARKLQDAQAEKLTNLQANKLTIW